MLSKVGVLMEQPAFYSSFSGRRNIQILLTGSNKKASKAEVDEALDRVGLLAHSEKRVRNYSKGMRTRLGIAHSIVRKSEIFVFDEPGTGLDPSGIKGSEGSDALFGGCRPCGVVFEPYSVGGGERCVTGLLCWSRVRWWPLVR